MDYGSRYSDRMIQTVDRRLRRTYNIAAKELAEKLKDFERRFAVKDKVQRSLKDSGQITEEAYQDWLNGQIFMKGQINDKIRQVAQVLKTHSLQAMRIVRDSQIDTFVENYNYSAFLAERGTGLSFNIFNTQSVAELIKKKPKILPEWKINEKKDYKWCYNKVNTIIRQGIIQGEGIPEITKRLSRDLSAQTESKMRTFARTAITEAQNSGRQQQMEDVADEGVEVMKEWVATLDDRTRDTHRILDGQRVPYDQPFKVDKEEIDYPGDPKADPSQVYNCRCTMVTVFPKYEGLNKNNWREGAKVGDKSYEEWKAGKQAEKIEQDNAPVESYRPENEVVQGKDISMSWERREDEFAFEINDVMDAQGFDGVPKVVGKEEFDQAVKESGFVAQRTYAAPDEETLQAYRDQLYNGEWYVDCSTGGAQYGQGMYCAADYNGKISDGMKNEMEHYGELGKSRYAGRTIYDLPKETQDKWIEDSIRKHFGDDAVNDRDLRIAIETEVLPGRGELPFMERMKAAQRADEKYSFMDSVIELRSKRTEAYSFVETLTLSPDAKIVTHREIEDIRQGNLSLDFRKDKITELLNGTKLSKDESTFIRYNLGMGVSWEEVDRVAKRIGSDRISELVDVGASIGERATELYNKEHEIRIARAKVYQQKYTDLGSLATALGYDAINAEGHGQSGSYTVILNRTKCIFLGAEK